MSKFDKKLVESKQTYLNVQPEPEPEAPKLQIEDVQTFSGVCDYFEEAWTDYKRGGMQAPTLSGVKAAAKTVLNPAEGIRAANSLYQKFSKGAEEFKSAADTGGAIGAAGYLVGSGGGSKQDGESEDGSSSSSELGVDGSKLKDLFAKTLMLQPNAGGNTGVKLGNFTYVFDPVKLQSHVVQNWKVGGNP